MCGRKTKTYATDNGAAWDRLHRLHIYTRMHNTRGANWNPHNSVCIYSLNENINHMRFTLFEFVPQRVQLCAKQGASIMRRMCHKRCFCLLYKVCCARCVSVWETFLRAALMQSHSCRHGMNFTLHYSPFHAALVSSHSDSFPFVSRDACKSNNTRCNTRRSPNCNRTAKSCFIIENFQTLELEEKLKLNRKNWILVECHWLTSLRWKNMLRRVKDMEF